MDAEAEFEILGYVTGVRVRVMCISFSALFLDSEVSLRQDEGCTWERHFAVSNLVQRGLDQIRFMGYDLGVIVRGGIGHESISGLDQI